MGGVAADLRRLWGGGGVSEAMRIRVSGIQKVRGEGIGWNGEALEFVEEGRERTYAGAPVDTWPVIATWSASVVGVPVRFYYLLTFGCGEDYGRAE